MSKDNKLIWEAIEPKFNSLERDRFQGVDKHMPTAGVKVYDEYSKMSDSELQDKLEAIQNEIERRAIQRKSNRV